MHLLRLFLTAWLSLGIVSVFFLFWLCKLTAQPTNAQDKPVLDQEAFQQLLAAACTLQEHNDRKLVKEAANSPLTVSPPPEPLADSELPLARNRMVRRPTPHSDEFFWRIATVVAMAAVSALLLVASSDRRSPVPAGLVVVQQQVPFRRGVASKTIVMEPQATKTGPTGRTVDADKPGRSAPARKKTVNPKRHSIYESEADMVAQDTVVRYGRRAAMLIRRIDN